MEIRHEEETSNLFRHFGETIDETDPRGLQGVCTEDISTVEVMVQADFLLCDIEVVDESVVTETTRRNIMKQFILILHHYYVAIVIVAMSPISKLFSKAIIACCEVKSILKLETSRDT